jgi:glycosyltransferase involved in cell wall biosynthesis
MKVAVVGTRGFPGVQGGIEKHCEKLYTHLVQKGCEVAVFTRKPYISQHEEKFRGITLISVDCPRNKFLEALVHTFICVIKSRRLSPDLLHIHGIGPSFFVPLARLMGMKVVVTNHGPDYMRKKWALPAKIFLKVCERIGVKYANEIIAISKNIADHIKTQYKKEATVLPNGVEIREIKDTSEALNMFGLQKGNYILAVGRFVPEKGFHDLIDAFCERDFKNFNLVIAGDADHEDKYSLDLKTKARKLDNVVLTGFLSERQLQELYSNAVLFVIPSYYEGLPIALLEAMSYGLSCIASNIPSNKAVALDEERYFNAGDVISIRDKINEFINRQWDQKERQKQVNMISERYNWNKIANDTFEVYERLIS